MATAFPSLPPVPGGQPSVGVGDSRLAAGPSFTGPSVEEQGRQVSNMIRDLKQNIQAVARQYPQGAEGADVAIQALDSMAESIITTLQATPGSEESPPALP